MLLSKIKQIENGTFEFDAVDGFPELFLAACRNNNITINDLVVESDSVHGRCEDRYLSELKRCAAKNHMELTVRNRKGLPYILHRYRQRIGVPVGILLAGMLLLFLSMYVWEIEIIGNASVPDKEILELLEGQGVVLGSPLKNINAEHLAYCIETGINKISWAAVNIYGSKVTVELRERVENLPVENEKAYSNLVAKANGELVRADVYKGYSEILPGDPVVKGDLLVSGVIPLNEGNKFVRSEADITARTRTFTKTWCLTNRPVSHIVRCKENYLLNFFFLHLPAGIPSKKNSGTVNVYSFTSGDTVFPVGVSVENYTEFEERVPEKNKRRALLRCFSDFSVKFSYRYIDSEIEKIDIEIKTNGNVSAASECICVENIAEERRFFYKRK